MEENKQKERHYRLLGEAQSEDPAVAEAATEALIVENMGLVRTAALRFCERGIEYEDLVQIGTIGMLRAIRPFDLSRGTAFSTFAVPLIVGEIKRNLRDNGQLHVSRTYKQMAGEIARVGAEFAAREGRDATVCDLADLLHTTKEEVAMAIAATGPVVSLSDTLFDDDKRELGEIVTDDESENEPAILTDRLALAEAIGKMPPLWRKILLLRYYRNCTQEEVARALGLTQVKVSREEKKILGFLRGEMIV